MRYLHANPLEYTDYDEFPLHPSDEEEDAGRRAWRARRAAVPERVQKRRQQEWRRIFDSIMSPAARQKAIARMENTRHDINLIVWSGRTYEESYRGSRTRTARFASAMKPNAINLLVSGEQLRDFAGGGIDSKTGDMKRSQRESIYTAHTLLHRIGDDNALEFNINRKWPGWDAVVNEETVLPYYGKNYRAVLREMVRRVAGYYLADPRGQGMFTGFGRNIGRAAAAVAAATVVARRVSLPIALLAFDPTVAHHFTMSRRLRFGRKFAPRFGEEPAVEQRERSPGDPEFNAVKVLRADVRNVFMRLLQALWYGAGTTWMSRMDIASDAGQVLADTFPQTEIYGGAKLEVGRNFGRTRPKVESIHPGVELPSALAEEVNVALVPVARAMDDYNNVVLDNLVGELVSI